MATEFFVSPVDIALRHCLCHGLREIMLANRIKSYLMQNSFDFTLKTAGSFMSFHIPSTPLEIKPFTSWAHHERALDCVKSGNTQGPGHTSPKYSSRLVDYKWNKHVLEPEKYNDVWRQLLSVQASRVISTNKRLSIRSLNPNVSFQTTIIDKITSLSFYPWI